MNAEQFFTEEFIKEKSGLKKEAMDRWRLILGKNAEDYDFNFNSDEETESISREEELDPNKYKQQKEDEKEGEKQEEGRESSLKKQLEDIVQEEANPIENDKEILISKENENKVTEKIGTGSQQKSSSGMKGREQGKSNGASSRKERSKITNFESGRSMGAKGSPSVDYKHDKLKKMDDTLEMVYGKNESQKGSAGLGPSNISIPNWIEYVKELFPKESKEVLEKDLIERSDIKDIIANPELFQKVEPSLEMVKTIISLKHMLPNDVKEVARNLVKRVVEDLKDKFKDEVEKHIIGAIKRDAHTPIKVFRNIDWKQSIRRNLKHYDPSMKKLIMAEPRFFSAEKKKKPWQIVVLIDESGSMTDSIIYSVVIASIFASLPAVYTNLVIFDTQVVDLSSRINDPVEVLMTVQLGGGTNISKAVKYGHSLIKNPKKTILVIISDFYEGGSYEELTKTLKQVLEGQTKILGVAALDYNSEPMYNRNYAKSMKSIGIDVLACTPKNLPEMIAKLML